MHNNFCSSGEGIILYSFDIKCSWSIWAPFMGYLSLLFWDNFDLVGDNERGIETNTKLTNDILFYTASSFFFEVLHEFFWAWFGNSA